jgi:hypothetical protein
VFPGGAPIALTCAALHNLSHSCESSDHPHVSKPQAKATTTPLLWAQQPPCPSNLAPRPFPSLATRHTVYVLLYVRNF